MIRLLLILALLLPAPAPRPRLLVIGDSLAVGLASSSQETRYASLVAREAGFDLGTLYVRDLPGAAQAWPGWGWPADVIVLEIGLNDVLGDTSPEATWGARYGALLDNLAASGARVVAATPFRGVYRGHPKWDQLGRYAGYIREEAAARHIAVADLWAIDCVPACLSQQTDATPYPPTFTGDNFHPNDAGHRRIADALLGALKVRWVLPVAG